MMASGESIKEHYTVVQRLNGHDSDVNGIEWSPDGKYLASCGLDGKVLVWDTQSFNLIRRVETEPRKPLKGLIWDPLCQYLAAQSNDGTLYVWRLLDWKLETLITSPYSDVGSVESLTYFSRPSWSPDGRVICLPDAMNENDPVALLIERDDWRCEQSLVGHGSALQVASFSPKMYQKDDSTHLVVALGAQDGGISFWCSGVERPLAVLGGVFEHAVMDISWSEKGDCLYAASYDGTVASVKIDETILGKVISDEEQKALMEKLGKVQKSAILTLPTSLNQIIMKDQLESIMSGRKIKGDAEDESPVSEKQGNDSPEMSIPLQSTSVPTMPIQPLTPQRESRLKNGKRRITPQLLQSSNPVTTPATESYTVMIGKAARKSWLRLNTFVNSTIGSVEITNFPNSNTCKIVSLQGVRVLWEDRLDALVTTATMTNSKILIAALNSNRIIITSPAGRRLLPPILLSAPVVLITSADDICAALLDNGLFYIWKVSSTFESVIQDELPPQGISFELLSLEIRFPANDITLEFAFSNNSRLIYSSRRRMFFDCEGTTLSDTLIDAIWSDPVIDHTGIARLLNQDSDELRARSLTHIEGQMAACQMIGDYDGYVVWLTAYVQRLALEENCDKLQELLDEIQWTSEMKKMISSLLVTSPSPLIRNLSDHLRDPVPSND